MAYKLNRAVDISMIKAQMHWRASRHRLKIWVGSMKEHRMENFLIDVDITELFVVTQ